VSYILDLRYSFEFCLCGYGAKFHCDWKQSADELCCKPICAKHAKEVAPGKHLCPFHQLQYATWKRRHPDKILVVEVGVQSNLFQEV
jgi:hypothetical protein